MSTTQESPKSTCDWFWTVPLITSAYDTVTSVYEGARDRNALTRFTLGTVESSVKLAGRCASPIVHKLESKLEKPLATVDAFALKKLQQLETTYPVIKKPSNEVISQGKEVLMETWEKGSQKIPGAKIVCGGVSVGSTVIGSTIKMSQQGINCTIDAGYRSINTANALVGRGVDRCLDATEAVVKYILPEEQEKSSMDEPLLTSSIDKAKKERNRRRQERRKRHEMRRAHHLSKTWAGRFERTQDIACTAVERTGDKVCEYSEWPFEHWKFLRTWRSRAAKACASAYETLQEHLEEAGDHLKTLNPLKMKEKKINLLTDSDDDDETSILERVGTTAHIVGTSFVSAAVYSLDMLVQAYQVTFGVSLYLLSQGCSYLGYTEEAENTSTPSSPVVPSPQPLPVVSSPQPFTVTINQQQGDTPMVEDGHHDDDNDQSESGDEGSSGHDEPEQKSDDD